MNDFKITEDYLETLPIIAMKAGDAVVKFRYDRESNRVFKLNEDGSYSGEWGYHPGTQKQTPIPVGTPAGADSDGPVPAGATPASNDAPPHEELPEEEESENAKDDDENSGDENDDADSGKEKRSRKPLSEKDKKFLAAVAIVVLLCLGYFAMEVVSSMKEQMAQAGASEQVETTLTAEEQTESEPETTESTAAVQDIEEETEPTAAATVDVICASEVLLPGTVLRSDMFDVITMDEADYFVLDADIGVFTVGEADQLTQLECGSYVPAGQILKLSDVTTAYTALNPWTSLPGEGEMVVLPVSVSADSLGEVCWGQSVDIEITVETKVQINNETEPLPEGETVPEETTIPGMEHYSSTVESKVLETYKLSSVQIVDALNADRESLYYRYSVWASIPAPYLMQTLESVYADRADISADIPLYIMIRVPAAQAKVLSEISCDQMTVALDNHMPAFENELQRDAYADVSRVCTAITEVWGGLE